MYAGYVLLLTLGLRRREMLGLAWEDVDLEGGEALIAWQVQRVDGSLLRRHTKTPTSDAPLPLPEIAVQALERHRVEEAGDGSRPGTCGATAAWSSRPRRGDPVDPRNFHRDFKLRAAKACVPVVPIYSTRRTCASLLVALDVHPRGRDGRPPAQPHRPHDGGLLPSLDAVDSRCIAPTGRAPHN